MITYGKQFIDQEDIDSVVQVLKSDFLTTGPNVENFENRVGEYLGNKFNISCGNGTQALHLAYMAIGLKKGDEVIVPANTFVATSNMVLACHAKPVFCDINLDNYNIDVEKIEKLITKKTKAITVVHFAGKPVNLEKVWKIAEKYNLKVIEDAAHAFGAEYFGQKIGNTKSDITTFSFHPVKPFTTGEGGLVATNNKEYYNKILRFRSHGIERDENGFNNMIEFGYNYRITDIQCALGISQLKKLDKFINYRNNIAKKYNDLLKNSGLYLQNFDENIKSGWHLYVIRFNNKAQRDNIFDVLRKNGYGITIHYPPVYTHKFYRENGYKDIKLKNCELYFDTALSLPIFYLLEDKEIEKICNLIIKNL